MRGEVCVERDVRGCGAVHNYVHSEGVSTAWAGHAAERTRNMLRMSVTLEVSTVSEWLNARAFCREQKGEGIAMRREVRGAGGRRVVHMCIAEA